jgi:hypothetical protein
MADINSLRDELVHIPVHLDFKSLANFACVSKLFNGSIELGVEKILNDQHLSISNIRESLCKFISAINNTRKIKLEKSTYQITVNSNDKLFVDSVSKWLTNKDYFICRKKIGNIPLSSLLQAFLHEPGEIWLKKYPGDECFSACSTYVNNTLIIIQSPHKIDDFYNLTFYNLTTDMIRKLLFYCFYYDVQVQDFTDA